MTPVRILQVSWGAADETTIPLRGMLESMPGRRCDLAQVELSCPPSEAETHRLSALVRDWSPSLMLLVLASGVQNRGTAHFFDLARRERWRVPVVAACLAARPEEAAELRQVGASDVLTAPFNAEEVLTRLLAAQTRPGSQTRSVAALRAKLGLGQIVGESPAFLAVLRQIPLVARHDVPVFILGETGTGKEVFARAIHYHGARAAKPFIPVNCGAIPVDLLENEFFGHEAGAFTSAGTSSQGVIRAADGGTLFLDEVDCLPALAQVKLLRFLQDGQFKPLGSERFLAADVRLIAASNINISAAMDANRFRRDLYYRLNVVSLKLPPLREREDDIVLLARHFLEKYAGKFHAPAQDFSPGALQKLLCHDWPGNVRELENVIQRAVVMTEEASIPAGHILTGENPDPAEDQNFRRLKAKMVTEFERGYLRRLLLAHEGNITKAAQSAGKDRRAFWELMRKHHIAAQPAHPAGPPAP